LTYLVINYPLLCNRGIKLCPRLAVSLLAAFLLTALPFIHWLMPPDNALLLPALPMLAWQFCSRAQLPLYSSLSAESICIAIDSSAPGCSSLLAPLSAHHVLTRCAHNDL